mmetsp:Transcript_1583/g.2778  ORF Transcript_1583/g.2778 Transcript_1583/m.2778 type:complete len:380 (-) Transcript_1583:57-1196(-)
MGNQIAAVWNDCPAASRLLLAGYPVVSLLVSAPIALTQCVPGDARYAAYMPLQPMLECYLFESCWMTVFRGWRIWSLVFASFHRYLSLEGLGMGFLIMLFELYSASQHLPLREREMGSSLLFVWLAIVAAAINLSHLIIRHIWELLLDDGYYVDMGECVPSQGLWPIVMMLVAIRCMGDPDGSVSPYGVCPPIKNKYYPACLAALFFFLSRRFDIVCGVALGYAYPYLRIERFLPSRAKIASCERRCCPERRRILGAMWVYACDTSGYEVESGLRPYAAVSDFGRVGGSMAAQGREMSTVSSSSNRGGGGRFECFAGSGTRLGDGNPEPPLVQESTAETSEMQPSLQQTEPDVEPTQEEHEEGALTKDSKDTSQDPEGL